MNDDIDKALAKLEAAVTTDRHGRYTNIPVVHAAWPELMAVVRAAEHRHEQGGHSRFCRKMTHDEACSCGDEALAAALAALAAKVGAT